MLLINHFEKFYPPLGMYYRTSLEWFLIAFVLYKVSINGYVLIRKRKNSSYSQCSFNIPSPFSTRKHFTLFFLKTTYMCFLKYLQILYINNLNSNKSKMDGYIVSVQTLIEFGFSSNYFLILPTHDGDVYIGIQIAHTSLS